MAQSHGDTAPGAFVVLSADESCFMRVSRFWVVGWPSLNWISDPLVLERMLLTGKRVAAVGGEVREVRLLGIMLDLTPPANATRPSSDGLARHLGATTAVLQYGRQLPLLLVCD